MYQYLQEKVLSIAVKAAEEKLMAGTSGNFSFFDCDKQIMAITPTNIEYKSMNCEDIAILDQTGLQLSGHHKPSSEWQMHLEIFKRVPNAKGIAHTHSPYATAFAVVNQPIKVILIEMVILGGEIPVAPFAFPGSAELGVNIAQTLLESGSKACLMANHGALAIGNSLDQALTNSIYLEDAAKIYHHAKAIGEPVVLPHAIVTQMKQALGI